MHKRLLQLLRDNAQRETKGLRMETTDEAVTLYLYDVIDAYWGVSAEEIVKQIAALKGTPTHLRINSPGGDVFEGRAMAAAIAQHGNVTAWVDGLAASAATYVATAARQVNIAEGAFFMIHDAWTFAYGNKRDLIDTAALLDKVDQSIVADYVRKTGKAADEIAAWMAAETWFTAQEAKDNGFADAVFAGPEANASTWNLSAFEHAPQAATQKPQPTQADIEAQREPLRAQSERRLRLLLPNA